MEAEAAPGGEAAPAVPEIMAIELGERAGGRAQARGEDVHDAATDDREGREVGRAASQGSNGAGGGGHDRFLRQATAIGKEACDEIERVRAEVLRQRGYASGGQWAQLHASREAGGLDHRHAFQHATAVLVDEIERVMSGPVGAPARVAVEAHMRATCLRMGWDGYGDVQEWHPTHLERILDEDMIGEAWLMYKLRAGIRTRRGGGGERVPREEGPRLWEASGYDEWKPEERGPCRIRIGAARTGGAAVRATKAGGGCEFTARMRRLAAAGMRTWADVTHREGRWLTWKEASEMYATLKDADRIAYEAVVGELNEERWEKARANWWVEVRTQR